MNYYYDVELNFLDKYYHFYEWDELDKLKYIKKIPLFNIDFNDYIKILLNKFQISKEFLSVIENHTITKEGYLKYACIFTDDNNSLAVLFNKEGISMGYSSLKLEDELNIEEISFTLKKVALDYQVIKKLNNDRYRQDRQIKKYINQELNNLVKNNNKSKLKYLYKELFQKEEEDIELMAKNIKKQINNKMEEAEYKLYEIIKLSYKNV